MNTLDVILTNTISYMTGILTGLFVSYYIKERKKKEGHTHELNLTEEFYDYFKVDLDNPLKKDVIFEDEINEGDEE